MRELRVIDNQQLRLGHEMELHQSPSLHDHFIMNINNGLSF